MSLEERININDRLKVIREEYDEVQKKIATN